MEVPVKQSIDYHYNSPYKFLKAIQAILLIYYVGIPKTTMNVVVEEGMSNGSKNNPSIPNCLAIRVIELAGCFDNSIVSIV
jgi:hypothetical protein